MCKGDLPRRRERCHLREEDTESQGQMGDRGVGRDVGREQWCAGLRGHSISNSPLGVRNNPSRHTHTHRADLPACHRALQGTLYPPALLWVLTETTAFNPTPLSSPMLWFPNHPTSHR